MTDPIEQAAKAYREIWLKGEPHEPWENVSKSARHAYVSAMTEFADRGLLAGTANTTEAEAPDLLGALQDSLDRAKVKRLEAEVARLRAELHANDLLAGDLVLEANRDRDHAVADLAALRDKVRALAEPDEKRCGFELVGQFDGRGSQHTVWVSPISTSAAYPPETICDRTTWKTREVMVTASDLRALLTDGGQS